MARSNGGMLPVFTEVIERTVDYQVRRGDMVLAIAGRYGADWQAVAQANSLKNPDRIYPGQRLAVRMRRIIPALLEEGIVINLPESMLYYFEHGRLVFHAGVGLGKPGRWRTPTGPFVVRTKERHPTWEVPISIQQEMEAEGRAVLTSVPPGPENPLGEFWLGLSIPGYGIHGTIAPASIGQFLSHGCIRMHPDDIRRLFDLTTVGTVGQLVYHPVKIAREESRVSVEVHPDIYRFNRPRFHEIEVTLRTLDIPLDWNRISQVLTKPTRMAEPVSLAEK